MAKKQKKVQKIVGVKAPGSQILVEMLRPEEALETRLEVPDNTKMPHQGYIRDIGPAVKMGEWGFEVGDRVLLQGQFVPVPWREENGRTLAVVDGYTIKCIFQEALE
jgi:hypothetical protein